MSIWGETYCYKCYNGGNTMNFLSIEKLWTENEIVFTIIEVICWMSSLDNIVNFDINYNSYYKEDVIYYKCSFWLRKSMKSNLSEWWIKDGLFFAKSQVVKSYPIMDFVTWVVVVFVVFLLPLFLFWSAETRKWGVGHASC